MSLLGAKPIDIRNISYSQYIVIVPLPTKEEKKTFAGKV